MVILVSIKCLIIYAAGWVMGGVGWVVWERYRSGRHVGWVGVVDGGRGSQVADEQWRWSSGRKLRIYMQQEGCVALNPISYCCLFENK